MAEFNQTRFVDLGQSIFIDLVSGLHSTLHQDEDGYGSIEDLRTTYRMLSEMALTAADEFAQTFNHQE
jgi:hypothetical protein